MFLTIFVFIVYLFAIFAIIGDLFRDHKQSGWAKALWIIFLILVPFLTALIYLIARGGGMAERQQAAAAAAQKQQRQCQQESGCAGPPLEVQLDHGR